MRMKQYCDRSGTNDFDTRQYFNGVLAKCQGCHRVLKPTPSGEKLRQHQLRGRATASYDKTMDILWDHAGVAS